MIDANSVPDDYLLRLFLADIKQSLREQAQAAILAACETDIERTIQATMDSLAPQLQTFYDMNRGTTVVQLSVRAPRES